MKKDPKMNLPLLTHQHPSMENYLILDTDSAMMEFRNKITQMTIIDIDMVEIGVNVVNAVAYKQVPPEMARENLQQYFRSHGSMPGTWTPDGQILADAIDILYSCVYVLINRVAGAYDDHGVLNYTFSKWHGNSLVLELFIR